MKQDKIQQLKDVFTPLIPILDSNLSKANKEYLSGEISHGAFLYVLSRHSKAHNFMNNIELCDDSISDCLRALVLCFIDLRTGVSDMSEVDQGESNFWIQKLSTFYRDNGFTGHHKFFYIPCLPRAI